MPCPHNEISIVQRSNRQSAVAAAAYQSGEKLFCEYDQEVKHYPEKRGIVHNEILLPANAPPEYADRSTLWNAAEAIEKQWNSQLARRWVLSIPREIPPDQYAALVRDFCNQQFVSKGMCVDFAIHDKGEAISHVHPLPALTARTKKENLRRTVSLMNGCGRTESAAYRTATTQRPVSYTHLDVYKRQALNHPFDEPKQWEIREVNDIMNHCVTGWNYFSNPRVFPEYGRQKGWERETKATDISNGAEKIPEGFEEVTEQMELPF